MEVGDGEEFQEIAKAGGWCWGVPCKVVGKGSYVGSMVDNWW